MEEVPGVELGVVDISDSHQISDTMIREANMLEGQRIDLHGFFDGLEAVTSEDIPPDQGFQRTKQ